MRARLLLSFLVLVELALAAVLTLVLRNGRLDLPTAHVVYLAGTLLAVAAAAGVALPVAMLRGVGRHGLLLLGCVLFAIPFAWLVGTSFKYDEEVFAQPPRWIPSVPSAVTVSPYLTAEEVSHTADRPAAVDADRWSALWPELERAIWPRARALLGDDRAGRFAEPTLRAALPAAVWAGVAGRLSDDAFATDASAVAAVERRVDAETVDAAWEAIYRGVSVKTPTVTDVDQLAHHLRPSPGWAVADGPARLAPSEAFTDVAYAFGDKTSTTVVGEFALDFPADRFFSLTLPIRQDRSWHELKVAVEVAGKRYVNEDRLYLGQRRWQEFTFKLKPLDDRDEREIGTFPLVASDAASMVASDRVRVFLTIDRVGKPTAAIRKFANNYRAAYFAAEHRWSYVANSAILVVLNVAGQLVSCSMAAYAFARLKFPGREPLFVVLLATMMLPAQVTMVPTFVVFKNLGLYNTLAALWVPSFFGSAFFIFMLRQFMRTIPAELEDAARIDGCGPIGIYWRVILPLVRPALAAVAIFTFMNVWNDFMGPLIYINDQRLYPLSLGLFDFKTEHGTEFGMLMAASTLMTLPVVAVFFLAQRYFIEGVTLTGMKG